MKRFGDGLQIMSLYDAICSHPEELRSIFVFDGNKLTPERFIDKIKSPKPMEDTKAQVYEWFMDYLRERGTERLLLISLSYDANYIISFL
jgi:hypothetical protein